MNRDDAMIFVRVWRLIAKLSPKMKKSVLEMLASIEDPKTTTEELEIVIDTLEDIPLQSLKFRTPSPSKDEGLKS
jgi:hypothetical protein